MIRTLVAILISSAAFAQPAFEVASVKPSNPMYRGPIDFRVLPGGTLRVLGLPLSILIQQAYGVKQYQLSGGPAWAESQLFNITAKAEGDPSREQLMSMLQTLLADRFQLKVHRETKDGGVYALVVAKGGSKLKEPRKDDEPSFVRFGRTGSTSKNALTSIIWGHKVSLQRIAAELSDRLHRPVLDRTGLQG